jgi:hypothetical protein
MRTHWRGVTFATAISANIFLSAVIATSLFNINAAAPVSRTEAPAFSIRWTADTSDTNKVTVEVLGLSAAALRELRAANWTPAQWQRLLTVRAGQGDLLADIGLPAMLGTYRVEADAIRFEPQFPMEPALQYRANFYPDKLPGHGAAPGKLASATFQLPQRALLATTVVREIYPSADMLPENLLKFYVHFSAPMSRGHIYEYIHLRDEAGKEIELPFLEIDEELWDREMSRLTLFIDPGRIKRGVKPLEEVGPALEAGKRYALFIDKAWKDATGAPLKETFRKTFAVSAPDREPVDPATWKVHSPKSDTRDPLTIVFSEPMDHALAQRVIRVTDGAAQMVAGQTTLEDHERRWTFVPAGSWHGGTHALWIQRTIEDLAGNNIGKSFEVDLFEGVQRRFTNSAVKLPFEVR